MKHLLSIADLDRESAVELLDEAERFEQALLGREVRKLPTLRGRTVMTVFFENSTRTRVSFEVAGKWMSADVINVSASSSSVSKGESLRDTAMTLRAGPVPTHSSCATRLRAPPTRSQSGPERPTTVAPAVINAGDGTHEHPTQALLDALTLRQRLGDIEGKRIAIVGDIPAQPCRPLQRTAALDARCRGCSCCAADTAAVGAHRGRSRFRIRSTRNCPDSTRC